MSCIWKGGRDEREMNKNEVNVLCMTVIECLCVRERERDTDMRKEKGGGMTSVFYSLYCRFEFKILIFPYTCIYLCITW